MRHGFVKVAAATPDIRVADVEYNTEQICRAIDQAYEKGAKIVAFPELCVTGYTCGDLFTQKRFADAAYGAVKRLQGIQKAKTFWRLWECRLQKAGNFITRRRQSTMEK